MPDFRPVKNLDLLGTTSRVAVPFVKVTIGNFVFGSYDKTSSGPHFDEHGVYTLNKIKFPNYIQSLQIQKINGTVNKYTLVLHYAITEQDDPNFFEKVFSSVSETRKIEFTYGDATVPSYVFRNEEAIILDVKKRFNIPSSVIQYTVKAVSKGLLSNAAGGLRFDATYDKPSNVIKQLLYSRTELGLLEVFPGMRNRAVVEQEGLILSDDVKVKIEPKLNISALDYLLYLVSIMRETTSTNTNIKQTFYNLVVNDDTSGKFDGVYFKIIKTDSNKDISTAYDIDIGIMSKDIITSFEIENDDTYSILYKYNSEINGAQYVQRINDRGEIEEVFAPVISSGTAEGVTTEADKDWWSRVTEFPIKASITFKGLLRPAMLMTHVRLNIYFYGRKFIDSGLYVVTKEVDTIDSSGYKTTLSLLRINKTEFDGKDVI